MTTYYVYTAFTSIYNYLNMFITCRYVTDYNIDLILTAVRNCILLIKLNYNSNNNIKVLVVNVIRNRL